MTTLTMRYIKGDFVVTGPDIEPTRFKTRREAKDWCVAHYPGSPIKEIGPLTTMLRKQMKQIPGGRPAPFATRPIAVPIPACV